jgi:carboxyl-terminal processing protease
VNSAALYRKAVDGLLFELRDPHSVYLPPERFAALSERTSGSYGGLGIEINARESGVEIITPLPNTPAERAGIQAGDRIVEVNGRATRGLSLEEASKLLRGRAGSPVTLVVERAGVSARLPFKLVREEIRLSPVQNASLLRPGLGYVDVSVFADSTAAELATGGRPTPTAPGPTAPRSGGRTCRSSSSWTAPRRAPPRSSPARCRTTTAP